MECRYESDLTDDIILLYEGSFSDIEKVPLDNIRRTFGNGGELMSYHDEGAFVGFSFSFINGGNMFLVYLATCPHLRSKGYGSKMLAHMREDHPDKVIFLPMEPLDPDAPDIALRERRHGFYIRNGCRDSDFTVISDGFPFMVLFLQGTAGMEDVVSTIGTYEDIHNGR